MEKEQKKTIILEYIKVYEEVSPKELTLYTGLSQRSVFKHLARLIAEGMVMRIGTPPVVFYRIKNPNWNTLGSMQLDANIVNESNLPKIVIDTIENNFLYITPLGEYKEGLIGFIHWCRERSLDYEKQALYYYETISETNKAKKGGLIDATSKLTSSLKQVDLKKVYYVDFYSVPQFGKSKLGQLLLYSKQGQDRKRIKQISSYIKPVIQRLVKKERIDAVGFIPPTVKRNVQFIKELERNLALTIPSISLVKISTEIIVPQKTLSKLEDRIQNARNTITVNEHKKYQNILLVDDAVGSGATLNEVARKLKKKQMAEKIYGLAITGSYKGFDVISEV